MLSRFPAATRMKSLGTGSDFVRAPDDRSDLPLMARAFSCIATRRACCSSILSILISSMYRTPLFALWTAPGSTRSWAGVARSAPDWNGSCLTSPSRAPDRVPVASMKGASSLRSCLIRSLGMFDSSPEVNLVLRKKYPKMSRNEPKMKVSMSPV